MNFQVNVLLLHYLANKVYGDSFELYDFVPEPVALNIIEDLHELSSHGELFDNDFKVLIDKHLREKYEGKQIKGVANPVYYVWQYIRGAIGPENTLLWNYFHGDDIYDTVGKNIKAGYEWTADTFVEPIADFANPISSVLWKVGTPILIFMALAVGFNLTRGKK